MIVCVYRAVRRAADFADSGSLTGSFSALMVFSAELNLTIIANMEMTVFVIFPFTACTNMVSCCGNLRTLFYDFLAVETEEIRFFTFFVTGRFLCVAVFGILMIVGIYIAVRFSADFADCGRNTGCFAAGMVTGSNGDFTVFYCEIDFVSVFVVYFVVIGSIRYFDIIFGIVCGIFVYFEFKSCNSAVDGEVRC